MFGCFLDDFFSVSKSKIKNQNQKSKSKKEFIA